MGNRTKFLRYRFGSGTEETLLPAWLTIFSPSVGAAETVVDQVIQPVSGYVDCRRLADVLPGDVLREGAAGSVGRVFVVSQVENRPATTRLLVAEIFPPIPDEFESGLLEAFWAADGDWVFDKATGSAQPTPLPSLTSPSVSSYLYQTISGNFDVWCGVRVDSGSAGAIRHAMLKAQANLLGPDLVAVGVRDNGVPTFYRADRVDPTLTTTDGLTVPSGLGYYLRLQRIGTRFRSFWAVQDSEPEKEAQWTEIYAPASGSWSTSGDVLIGLAAYQNSGTSGLVHFDFFRNWQGD